jgi:hypothetical protein
VVAGSNIECRDGQATDHQASFTDGSSPIPSLSMAELSFSAFRWIMRVREYEGFSATEGCQDLVKRAVMVARW